MANDIFAETIEAMVDDILVHELRDVVEIRQLLPEDQWDRYAAMEIEDLREQLLLKEALKRLRTKFREVLNHGRKKKSGDQEDQDDAS